MSNYLAQLPDNYSISVITDVTSDNEVVSLAQAKAHLRVTEDLEDGLIRIYIAAARQHVQNNTNRIIGLQTWRMRFTTFPTNGFKFANGPINSITSIKYYDVDGIEQTLSTSVYRLINDAVQARVILKYGQTWPNIRAEEDGITVLYTCGYNNNNVPMPLKQAILLQIGDYYENKEASISIINSKSNPAFMASLRPYQLMV